MMWWETGEMVEKIKNFWHDQIPLWLPIAISILGGAFYVGQLQQSVMDRLGNLEKQVMCHPVLPSD